MRKLVAATAALLLAAAPGAAMQRGRGDLPMIALDALRVPIIDGDLPNGTLRLKLVLEAADPAAAARIAAELPALRAASLGAAIEFARLYASPMVPVDVAKLGEGLTAALKQRESGVARVLMVEVAAAPATA